VRRRSRLTTRVARVVCDGRPGGLERKKAEKRKKEVLPGHQAGLRSLRWDARSQGCGLVQGSALDAWGLSHGNGTRGGGVPHERARACASAGPVLQPPANPNRIASAVLGYIGLPGCYLLSVIRPAALAACALSCGSHGGCGSAGLSITPRILKWPSCKSEDKCTGHMAVAGLAHRCV
jgi:hypothetical protein